jgi:4-alpha-glucanotransferase
MKDADVFELASRAGIAIEWQDYAGRPHSVSLDTIRHILTALGLPCAGAGDLAQSRAQLEITAPPPLITATIHQPVTVPCAGAASSRARIIYEDGTAAERMAERTAHGYVLPPIAQPGYHRIEFAPGSALTLAVAPGRCVTTTDLTGKDRAWGLAVQTYGLRSPGDCGIGDMSGVVALARAAVALKADALALSPTHALFSADPGHFGPYSPSNRLFYNSLHADAAAVFGEERVATARSEAAAQVGVQAGAQVGAQVGANQETDLIDWPRASHLKMAMFRRLFEQCLGGEFSNLQPNALADDFREFRSKNGAPLAAHVLFETLHAARLRADARAWNWQDWPPEWRDPSGRAVRDFAAAHEHELLFHAFLQWLADRSFAGAQKKAVDAGMRVGLITDLAVGMHVSGSATWSDQNGVLTGLQIGAPPDLFNPVGQNWGLTTFSPRALVTGGYASFIATLRAAMRHAGGVRIDHAMGLMRLWVTPIGAQPSEGAYLAYPLNDLLRLTALESHRHRAVLIGEDLGTVPQGFREQLSAAGIYGMNVLWFERRGRAFRRPRLWPTNVAAMSSTHDLPTVAGWWRGHDIDVRARCGLVSDPERERAARNEDRIALRRAFRSAKLASGEPLSPERPAQAVDATIKFVAAAPSHLTLLPLEDALALEEQPNLPGTIDQHPNWRRRYDGAAANLLDRAEVRQRLKPLAERQRK